MEFMQEYAMRGCFCGRFHPSESNCRVVGGRLAALFVMRAYPSSRRTDWMTLAAKSRTRDHGMMSGVLRRVIELAERREVRISEHGYDELMRTRRQTKIVKEGQNLATVLVDVMDVETGWAPYLAIDDAYRLDDVRLALRRGDLKTATRLAEVFTLTPVQN